MNRSAPMKRTPMKRARPAPYVKPERVVKLPAPRAASLPRGVMVASTAHSAVEKPTTHRSAGWLGAVRSIACVHCGGLAEAAHANIDKGMGLKADDCAVAALCREEHRRIDQGKDLTRDERRALMDRYIVLTLIALVREGRVVVE